MNKVRSLWHTSTRRPSNKNEAKEPAYFYCIILQAQLFTQLKKRPYNNIFINARNILFDSMYFFIPNFRCLIFNFYVHVFWPRIIKKSSKLLINATLDFHIYQCNWYYVKIRIKNSVNNFSPCELLKACENFPSLLMTPCGKPPNF